MLPGRLGQRLALLDIWNARIDKSEPCTLKRHRHRPLQTCVGDYEGNNRCLKFCTLDFPWRFKGFLHVFPWIRGSSNFFSRSIRPRRGSCFLFVQAFKICPIINISECWRSSQENGGFNSWRCQWRYVENSVHLNTLQQ